MDRAMDPNIASNWIIYPALFIEATREGRRWKFRNVEIGVTTITYSKT